MSGCAIVGCDGQRTHRKMVGDGISIYTCTPHFDQMMAEGGGDRDKKEVK